MNDQKRKLLLLIADIAGVALTIVGSAMSLVRPDPYSQSADAFLAYLDAGGLALFAGIALLGFSAYRRGRLGWMLLLAVGLIALLTVRIAIEGAIAAGVPTLAWSVFLALKAKRGEPLKRGCVASVFIVGALLLLVLGYFLPIIGVALTGLSGGGHGPQPPPATPAQIATCFVPAAVVALGLVVFAVFLLLRKPKLVIKDDLGGE